MNALRNVVEGILRKLLNFLFRNIASVIGAYNTVRMLIVCEALRSSSSMNTFGRHSVAVELPARISHQRHGLSSQTKFLPHVTLQK